MSFILSSHCCWFLFTFPIKSTLQGKGVTFFNSLSPLRYLGSFCDSQTTLGPRKLSRTTVSFSSHLCSSQRTGVLSSAPMPCLALKKLYKLSTCMLRAIISALASSHLQGLYPGNLCSDTTHLLRFLALSLSLCRAQGQDQAEKLTLCQESTVSPHPFMNLSEHFLPSRARKLNSLSLSSASDCFIYAHVLPEGPRVLKFKI